jgi:hypothetical protein
MDSDILVEQQEDTKPGALPEPDAFCYFVEPVELDLRLPEWPDQMRLLLCMDAAGLCEFVVYHTEEEYNILDRVAEILDRPVGEFAISPEVEGYPARRLRFSEENALLKAIQDSKSLQETATDYLINYTFAQEEGLDFDKLMRPRRPTEDDKALRVTTGKIFSLGAKGTRRKRVAPAGLPAGYAPVDEVAPEDCCYLSLEMWLVGGRIRIAEGAVAPTPIIPTLAREIALRDDFSSVYIARDVLPKRWTPDDELVIDIPAELFPAGFAANCGRRKVQVAVMPRGIFVEFGAPVPASEPVETAPHEVPELTARPARPRARSLRSFFVPVIAVAGLGITGFFSTIIAQTIGSDDPAVIAQGQP